MNRLTPASPWLAILVVVGACSAPNDEPTTPTFPTPRAPMTASPASQPPATPASSSKPAGPSFVPSPSDAGRDDPLLAATLEDVRTGDSFTLQELATDGPVIVETMAIWCTNCRSQMHQVTAAHQLADFHSVSIDVEPAEAASDLAEYAEREGFDWPFVLADATLATELRERFGTEVLFPPGMPKLLVRPDGSMELLPLGELLSADEIAALVGR